MEVREADRQVLIVAFIHGARDLGSTLDEDSG
jgi:hypothetical protein